MMTVCRRSHLPGGSGRSGGIPWLILFLAVTAAGCACRSTQRAHSLSLLHATAWVQTSTEFKALALAAYEQAKTMLDRGLADPAWTAALEQAGAYARFAPAVILDLDQTVLDNAAYEAWLIRKQRNFTVESWDEWVAAEQARAIPGAREFTLYARQKGVTVFYVTNRSSRSEASTRRNLASQGFPLEDGIDTLLMKDERPGWGSNKRSRREAVAQTYRILLLIGDDLGDFCDAHRADAAERVAVFEENRDRWGTQWLVIPNPMYGSWENELYGFRHDLPDALKTRRMIEALESWEGQAGEHPVPAR